jgi:signal transduction histidine kinase
VSDPQRSDEMLVVGARRQQRDLLLSAVVLAVQLLGTHAVARHHAGAHPGAWWASTAVHSLDWGAYLLLCVGPLALLAKRAHPRAVLAVVFAATAAYALIGYPAGPAFLSLIVAFWFVVSRGDRVVALGCIATGWVVFLWLPWAIGTGGRPSAAQAAGLAAWLLVLLFAGEAVRARRERVAAVRRGREQEGLRRAEEERLRIARELHDVLAHNISLINVQSGVALHLLDERPEQARTALAVINDASAEALREIRSVLGVLRGVDERAPRRPAASLERLPDLISQSAAAGLDVDVRIDGEPRPLPSDVDLAAYRIVQESLTNVSRHARTGQARVRVRYEDRELALEVDDDGGRSSGADTRDVGGSNDAHRDDGGPAAPPTAGTGNGIVGMRERAASLGGELRAGPRAGGGFRVSARLPLGGGA